jgi:membrane protease YdiL (CAAX protease family)
VRLLPHDAWLAAPVAWLVFVGVGHAVKVAMRGWLSAPKWVPHAILKMVVLVLSFGAAAVEGLSLRDLGLRAPQAPVWGAAIGGGLALGATGTLVMLLANLEGLRKVVGQHSFATIVVWFWIVSSVAEEVFCRGWFQGSTMSDVTGSDLGAQLPSAVLFGSLHLVLLWAGVERRAVAVVVVSTAILGLRAAWARAASASLYPAIGAHVAFNVGGAVGGIAYAVGYRAVKGKMPFQSA